MWDRSARPSPRPFSCARSWRRAGCDRQASRMPAYRPFWLGIERRKKPLNRTSSLRIVSGARHQHSLALLRVPPAAKEAAMSLSPCRATRSIRPLFAGVSGHRATPPVCRATGAAARPGPYRPGPYRAAPSHGPKYWSAPLYSSTIC